jgi:cytochrome P450 family 6
LIVRDPELIKHILVRDFQHFVDRPTLAIRGSPYIVNMLINMKGQHWKNVRALLTPTFSSGKLKAMENLVEQCGQHMATFLHNESK